ncbi:MAG TPA: hypothetical protein VFR37_16655 [Longimicrobium sp.]|nr:hypothetical protein [Longimicrobium sp.]
MTFDDALDHPGRLLAAWDLTAVRGRRTLTLFSLDDDRALALASRTVAMGEEDAATEPLRGRGIAVGECDGGCDFVWAKEADGVTVWGPHWRVLQASGDTLVLADGRTLTRSELARIQSYATSDYIERGVRAWLRSGEAVSLVREVSAAAAADPTYSRNELLYDTEWAGAIAAAVAAWAGVPWEDLI